MKPAGLGTFFEEFDKLKEKHSRKANGTSVDEKTQQSMAKRKQARMSKHRTGVFGMVATETKIETVAEAEKPLPLEPEIDPMDFLNAKLLTLHEMKHDELNRPLKQVKQPYLIPNDLPDEPHKLG